jgi:hypothetical protein
MTDNHLCNDDGTPDTPKMSNGTRKQFAVHKASRLAQEIKQSQKAKSPSQFIKFSKESITFKINTLKARCKKVQTGSKCRVINESLAAVLSMDI